MDGYFLLDQMARMKFRLLHLLLEFCKYFHTAFFEFSWARSGSGKICTSFPRKRLVIFHGGSTYLLVDFFASQDNVADGDFVAISMIYVSVSVANNFVPQCWRNSFCLEKTCDRFVICQDNCWLRCFIEIVCKLKKCHVNRQKFF